MIFCFLLVIRNCWVYDSGNCIVFLFCIWCFLRYFQVFFWSLLNFTFGKQLEKIPIEDIKKELKSAELSEVAIEELLQVLSVKSLEKLEGF